MIELKNVSKYYHNNGVVTIGLKNVSLSLEKNEIVAITGESGSGKSTLLNVICGVDTYEDGEILFNGEETSYFNQNDMDLFRKKHVSFIYQQYNIIDSYTVLENVMLPLLINGYSKSEAKKRALELIEEVGLKGRIHNKGIRLSGGEKQRCVIARALATDAEILACDEPTGNLDSVTGAEIIELIKKVAKDKLVLIVTHNIAQVEDIITRKILVSDGEILEDSGVSMPKDEINTDIKLIEDENTAIKKKTLYGISMRNIKNTPKKTFFTTLVFLAFAFVVLLAYLTCLKVANDVERTSIGIDFNYDVDEKVYAFSKDDSSIDISSIELGNYEYYKNFTLEDNANAVFYYSINATNKTTNVGLSYHMPVGVNIEDGSVGTGINDAFVVMPEYYYSELVSYIPYLVNTSVKVSDDMNVWNDTFNITGYGIYENIGRPYVILNKSYDVPNFVYLYQNLGDIQVSIDDLDANYIELVPNGKTKVTYYGPTDKYSSLATNASSLSITYKDKYNTKALTSVDYVYAYNDTEQLNISLSAEDFEFDGVYELTIYAKSLSDTDNVKKILADAGYGAIAPNNMSVNKMSYTFVLSVFLIVISTIGCLILVLVVYAITGRVYASRDKDYTIMRSLGILKKNMKHIVDYEVMFLGLLSAALSVALMYGLSFFVKYFKDLIPYNNVWFMIAYFLAMAIFSFLIARRFNRRLFKFSVSTSIKGDVVRND